MDDTLKEWIRLAVQDIKKLGINGYINVQRIAPPHPSIAPTGQDGKIPMVITNVYNEYDANLLKIAYTSWFKPIIKIAALKEDTHNGF